MEGREIKISEQIVRKNSPKLIRPQHEGDFDLQYIYIPTRYTM